MVRSRKLSSANNHRDHPDLVRATLVFLLAIGLAGCTKDQMKRQGITFEGGKVKKCLISF